MFPFFKRKENEKNNTTKSSAEGAVLGESIAKSTQGAKKQFHKPEKYTGNRQVFDDGAAKRNVKTKAFQEGNVHDPYTGQPLELKIKDAKAKYGVHWQEHVAEADHTMPLERVHEMTKDKPWMTTEDVREIANHTDNLEVVSRKFNNVKRSRTNEELMNDLDYLEEKGLHLDGETRERVIARGEEAKTKIQKKGQQISGKNMRQTAHNAGKNAAFQSGVTVGTISTIQNMVAVVNGEKEADEALCDVGEDVIRSAATAYGMSSAITTFNHTFSNSNSKFIQALSNSKFQSNAIMAVMVTGNTLSRWCNDEISTQECVLELGEKGLIASTTGTSMAMGQALIPIPIVGAAIGAMVGSTLISAHCQGIISYLEQHQVEEEQRRRLILEHEQATAQLKAYQAELESYLEAYFQEYQGCFDAAMSDIRQGLASGDSLQMISGANQITRKLGGVVHYDTMEEFCEFFDSDEVVEF